MAKVMPGVEVKETAPAKRLEDLGGQAEGVGAILADYKEVMLALADLEVRKDALRQLLQEAVIPFGAVVGLGVVARWYPESKTEGLDRGALVAAGVTPKQLDAGTIKGTKKGYLKVQAVKEGGE